MGRTHDHYCPVGKFWWSPFTFDACPEHGDECDSFYDLNHEAELEPAPLDDPEEPK